MIIAIDLHNIRDGGGVNYIRNLLEAADPERDGFTHVHLIGSPRVLAWFPNRPWATKHGFDILDRPLPVRLWFIFNRLPKIFNQLGCDVLYAPGGVAFGNVRPYVTISRNMMPFRPNFWGMYARFSRDRARLRLLRRINFLSFARADGLIYLSETAREVIGARAPITAVISHGVDHNRFRPLRAGNRRFPEANEPVRVVYPSRLEPYKHQLEVLDAFAQLAREYPNARLDLYGPANPAYLPEVEASIRRSDPDGVRIRYHGEIANAELPRIYAESDLLVFASSCENLPNILIEAMACGIPICSSERSPMPEVGGGAFLYFDPEQPGTIAESLREALNNPKATAARAAQGVAQAQAFSWERTARDTFGLLAAVARTAQQQKVT
jgi:glycosyltransferase involved in cell wall biosynthesis